MASAEQKKVVVVEDRESQLGGGNDEKMKMKMKMVCVVCVLRALAGFATVSAAVVMSVNKQTITTVVAIIGNTPIKATVSAKFHHTPAFIFFVIANSMASFHNLLMLTVELSGHKFDTKGRRHFLIPVLDMLNVGVISGGAAAASFMGELGRNGNSHARWNKICDKFQTYCNHGSGAILASFIALLLMILINIISIAKLRAAQKSPALP